MTSPAAPCASSDNENDDLAPFLPQPNFPWNNPDISNDDSDILGLINHASNNIIAQSSESKKYEDDKEFVLSSPVRGTLAERKAARHKKGQKCWQETVQVQKKAQDEAESRMIAMAQAHEEQRRVEVMEAALKILDDNALTMGDLMLHFFHPAYNRQKKWTGFFQSGHVGELLNMWVGQGNSHTGRIQVHKWACAYVCRIARAEATSVTRQGFLQSARANLDATFFLNFSFSSLYGQLVHPSAASVTMSIFRAFSTSPHILKYGTKTRMRKIRTTLTSATLQCLGTFSHANNVSKCVLGVYMYATGSQCQPITLLSHLGISDSYPSIVGTMQTIREGTSNISNEATATTVDDNAHGQNNSKDNGTKPAKTQKYKTGTLLKLSGFMRSGARMVTATGLFAGSYDNINIAAKSAEQIIGRNSTQDNGTCATLFPLWKAKLENMRMAILQAAFDNAAPLKVSDILHTGEEAKLFKQCLLYCILRIIITHGGEGFKKFKADLERTQLNSNWKIDIHRTELWPLPSWLIDESTIIGNTHVVDAFYGETNVLGPDFLSFAKFLCRDQLSIARKEGGYTGFGWGIWIPGLFHAKIADCHGLMTVHWGKPNAGVRNPGSLAFHNTVLNRLPIKLTSLPTFRVSRDLVFVSLYGRVLHCLLRVSGKRTLQKVAESVQDWDMLVTLASTIKSQFTNVNVMEDLRDERKSADITEKGDIVYKNTVLFLRDGLIAREFHDAIKCGDSGCILLVLKIWALSYRGSGRTKYAYEMLYIIHNLTHVWPKGIRDIILNNWLVNTTGRDNGFCEVDLMQEHMNFWIKSFYKAHGSNASWEWLEMISPCVNILRHFTRSLNSVLGANLGTNHAPPDLMKDIAAIMKSLKQHDVYVIKRGRVLDDDDAPVKDIIAVGLQQLTHGKTNPLKEYNKEFSHLQARRRLVPVVPVQQTDNDNDEPQPEPEAASGSDTSASEVDSDIEAEKGELEMLLEELANGNDESSLAQEMQEDVSLDMDGDQEDDEADIDDIGTDLDASEVD
ncbi:hypothetical protein EDD85DRAFT_924132 [Armillaria nabsnona]|nr:hypothetical protein EDD85DRAFT_924132 [Armillaria nabsnona]